MTDLLFQLGLDGVDDVTSGVEQISSTFSSEMDQITDVISKATQSFTDLGDKISQFQSQLGATGGDQAAQSLMRVADAADKAAQSITKLGAASQQVHSQGAKHAKAHGDALNEMGEKVGHAFEYLGGAVGEGGAAVSRFVTEATTGFLKLHAAVKGVGASFAAFAGAEGLGGLASAGGAVARALGPVGLAITVVSAATSGFALVMGHVASGIEDLRQSTEGTDADFGRLQAAASVAGLTLDEMTEASNRLRDSIRSTAIGLRNAAETLQIMQDRLIDSAQSFALARREAELTAMAHRGINTAAAQAQLAIDRQNLSLRQQAVALERTSERYERFIRNLSVQQQGIARLFVSISDLHDPEALRRLATFFEDLRDASSAQQWVSVLDQIGVAMKSLPIQEVNRAINETFGAHAGRLIKDAWDPLSQTFKLSAKAINEINESMGRFTSEQTKQLAELNSGMTRVTGAWKSAALAVAREFAPEVEAEMEISIAAAKRFAEVATTAIHAIIDGYRSAYEALQTYRIAYNNWVGDVKKAAEVEDNLNAKRAEWAKTEEERAKRRSEAAEETAAEVKKATPYQRQLQEFEARRRRESGLPPSGIDPRSAAVRVNVNLSPEDKAKLEQTRKEMGLGPLQGTLRDTQQDTGVRTNLITAAKQQEAAKAATAATAANTKAVEANTKAGQTAAPKQPPSAPAPTTPEPMTPAPDSNVFRWMMPGAPMAMPGGFTDVIKDSLKWLLVPDFKEMGRQWSAVQRFTGTGPFAPSTFDERFTGQKPATFDQRFGAMAPTETFWNQLLDALKSLGDALSKAGISPAGAAEHKPGEQPGSDAEREQFNDKLTETGGHLTTMSAASKVVGDDFAALDKELKRSKGFGGQGTGDVAEAIKSLRDAILGPPQKREGAGAPGIRHPGEEMPAYVKSIDDSIRGLRSVNDKLSKQYQPPDTQPTSLLETLRYLLGGAEILKSRRTLGPTEPPVPTSRTLEESRRAQGRDLTEDQRKRQLSISELLTDLGDSLAPLNRAIRGGAGTTLGKFEPEKGGPLSLSDLTRVLSVQLDVIAKHLENLVKCVCEKKKEQQPQPGQQQPLSPGQQQQQLPKGYHYEGNFVVPDEKPKPKEQPPQEQPQERQMEVQPYVYRPEQPPPWQGPQQQESPPWQGPPQPPQETTEPLVGSIDKLQQPLEQGATAATKFDNAVSQTSQEVTSLDASLAQFAQALQSTASGTKGATASQHGGLLGGKPGVDANLGWFSKGEYVMDTGTVQHYGVPFMQAIHAKRFQVGGYVDRGASALSAAATQVSGNGGRGLHPVTMVLPSGRSVSGFHGEPSAVAQISREASIRRTASAGRRSPAEG